MKTTEFDIVFLSYDEPNADAHYADLINKAPWAKRVHGVKGSDAAHKAAAELSETDWFVSVDADNIVDIKFFDYDVTFDDENVQTYSWVGRNRLNGLRYGNGGLKLWKKQFVLDMKTHEAAVDDRAQVDFCWEDGYKQFPETFSETIITGDPYQAWRAGFREGVKMTLHDGVRVHYSEIRQRVWWHNLHRLRIWSTVGAHEENGLYAVLGARMGTYMTNCTEWNYVEVRDFEALKKIYDRDVKHSNVEDTICEFGEKIKRDLGFDWPYMSPQQSKYTLELYEETLKMAKSYYKNV